MAQPPDLVRRTRFLVKTVLVGAAVLLGLLLTTFLIVPHESMPESIIVFWGLFILITALIAGISAAYVFLTRAHEAESRSPTLAETGTPAAVEPPTGPSSRELEDLAIRLLDGDEQRLVRVIVEAKGSILQRDLVRITTFTDAKVSRLLDRLERRGLIVRERHGMTNRVRMTLKDS